MSALAHASPAPARGTVARAAFTVLGFAAMGMGFIGFLVPGLPSTVFFVAAAWCFARASRRLEAWFLGLPAVGPLVRDYRAGLGMPRSAKVMSVITMWTAIAISSWVLRDRPLLIGIIGVLGLIGTYVVVWRVPCKERLLAAQSHS